MTTRTKKETTKPEQVQAVRDRQASMTALVDKHFGPVRKTHPELWSQRTFLLIVAKIYDSVVNLCDADTSPKEILDLARSLGEACKAGANSLDAAGRKLQSRKDEATQDSKLGGVIDGLEQIVRQLYGTNLQISETTVPPSATAITKTTEEL